MHDQKWLHIRLTSIMLVYNDIIMVVEVHIQICIDQECHNGPNIYGCTFHVEL